MQNCIPSSLCALSTAGKIHNFNAKFINLNTMFIILMLNSPGKIAIATNPPRASRDKQAQIYEKY